MKKLKDVPSNSAAHPSHSLQDVLGFRFITYLIIIQLFGKGLLYGIVGSLVLPLYQLIGIDGVSYQLYATIAEIPWSLKPIFGVLSDLLVIGHYNKRYWLVLGNFIGSSFALLLAIFLNLKNSVFICFCFFAMELQIALQDLMTEAKYAEIMRDNPESGSSIVSFVNALNSMGTLISVIIVGILADKDSFNDYTILLYVCFGISLLPVIPTLLGWLPEVRVNKCLGKTQKEDEEEVDILINEISNDNPTNKSNTLRYALVFSTGLISIVIAIVFVFSTLAVAIITSVSLIIALLVSYKAFGKLITNAILYRCLTYLTYWGLSGALGYFYTSSCVKDGPHFSYEYYITWTGVIGAVMSFLGASIYQFVFGKTRIRSALIITIVLSMVFSFFDVIIAKRWNLVIGIPDKWAYMFGDAICYNLIDMLNYIPLMTLISKICPKKLETTTYAFVSGISNLARILSYIIGAYATDWFKIQTVIPCNFDNLWILVLIGHISLSLLVLIPATFILIPNILPTDDIEK